jgi:hypothetical protein
MAGNVTCAFIAVVSRSDSLGVAWSFGSVAITGHDSQVYDVQIWTSQTLLNKGLKKESTKHAKHFTCFQPCF